jgi:hypothetical protein
MPAVTDQPASLAFNSKNFIATSLSAPAFLTALAGTQRAGGRLAEESGKGQAICEWRRMMLKESTTASIHEIVVTATEEALNAAIAERGIQPDKIISVIYEPRRELAIGDYGAKYRVIYRS